MSSFGFSIGDIISISNYAYSVYKSCKNAGDNFNTISADVESLRTLLIALDNECSNPQSSFQQLPHAQKGELAARLQDCKADLRSVKKLLHDFRSLNTRDARYRDKLAFTTGKQTAIREKLATHSVRIQQLLSGINVATFSRIERNTEAHYLSLLELHAKLDKIHEDISSGRRDAVAFDDTDGAVALEDEVLQDNMTEIDVDVSYEVHAWVERVRMECLHTESVEPHASEDTPRTSPETPNVEPMSDIGTLTRVRYPSAHDSGDSEVGRKPDQQSSRYEDVEKRPDASEALESIHTPGSPHVLKENPKSTSRMPTDTADTDEYDRMIIELQDWYQDAYASQYYYEWYSFHEQEECWVKKPHRKRFLRSQEFSRIVYLIRLTLEEVFSGTIKFFTLRRATTDPKADSSVTFDHIKLDLQIQPGLGDGDIIRYTILSNPLQKHEVNVIFKIKYRRHLFFDAIRAHLAHTITLTDAELKEGWKREAIHLNGKVITVRSFGGPTNDQHIVVLRGKGLPYSNPSDKVGSLLVQVRYQNTPSLFKKDGRALWGHRNLTENGFSVQLDAPKGATVYSARYNKLSHPLAMLTFRERLEKRKTAASAGEGSSPNSPR